VKPIVTNTADPKQVKSAKRRARNQREDELADLRWMLSAVEGRRILHRISEHCWSDAPTFSSDALLMAAREGERNVWLWLKKDLTEANPKGLALVLFEAQEREQHEDRVTAVERPPDDEDDVETD
jgi:hypothetical protein